MAIITIENDGEPWVICEPGDTSELERFLNACEASAVGVGFTNRAANPAEIKKFKADLMIFCYRGGDPQNFFATSA